MVGLNKFMDDFKKRSKYFIILVVVYITFSLFNKNKYNLDLSLSQYWILIVATIIMGIVYGAYRTHKGMHE